MKVLKKDYIIRKNQVEHTKTERSVLGYVHHPYIVGLAKAFQTSDKLFFVLDYCAGGELFFHLGNFLFSLFLSLSSSGLIYIIYQISYE